MRSRQDDAQTNHFGFFAAQNWIPFVFFVSFCLFYGLAPCVFRDAFFWLCRRSAFGIAGVPFQRQCRTKEDEKEICDEMALKTLPRALTLMKWEKWRRKIWSDPMKLNTRFGWSLERGFHHLLTDSIIVIGSPILFLLIYSVEARRKWLRIFLEESRIGVLDFVFLFSI